MKLRRELGRWAKCSPKEMAKMSPAAIYYAFEDAKEDISTLAELLLSAAYPRHGTEEEEQDIFRFAEKVQAVIPFTDAIEFNTLRAERKEEKHEARP